MFVIHDLIKSNFPLDWKTFLIRDFCNVKTSNLSFSELVKYNDSKHEKPIKVLALKVSDMNLYGNETFIKKSNYHILVNPKNPILEKLIPPNSIIFPKRGAAIATNKKRILTEYAVLDPNLIAVEPDSSVDALYLFFYFQNFDLSSLQDPGTIPQLNKKDLDPFPVIVPSLPEQRNINHILTSLQNAIEKQQQIIDTTQALKKSLLHQLFTQGTKGEKLKETEIGMMPESWMVKEIGEIFKFSSGKPRPKNTVKIRTEKNPYPAYGGNGVLGYTTEFLFNESKLILGRVGEYCGCSHITEDFSWISDNALYAKEILEDVSLRYFKFFFDHYDLNRFSNKNGQPLITQGGIKSLQLGLPPKEEQIEIATILNSIDKKILYHSNKKQCCDSLFKSFLNELMTGSIRVDQLEFEV